MRMDNKVAEAIREENRRLRLALEFYANQNNYSNIFTFNPLLPWEEENIILNDIGARAREALKEIE